jgi:DNA repair exonuclease SbcCD ATPase subunit
LFDRTPRTTKSISLLNTKKETLWGKITLLIDGKCYII